MTTEPETNQSNKDDEDYIHDTTNDKNKQMKGKQKHGRVHI
jgi:hypothetical protein